MYLLRIHRPGVLYTGTFGVTVVMGSGSLDSLSNLGFGLRYVAVQGSAMESAWLHMQTVAVILSNWYVYSKVVSSA